MLKPKTQFSIEHTIQHIKHVLFKEQVEVAEMVEYGTYNAT
jgi:hypothetical protein